MATAGHRLGRRFRAMDVGIAVRMEELEQLVDRGSSDTKRANSSRSMGIGDVGPFALDRAMRFVFALIGISRTFPASACDLGRPDATAGAATMLDRGASARS